MSQSNSNCICKSIEHKLVYDDLILKNMFKLEEFYLIQSTYFNSNITNEMRSTLSTWILEVCEEEKLTNQVFYLAMNIFDRFMCALANSAFKADKSHLQLFGTCCLFIASKVRSPHQLNALKLIEYTDNSVRLDELLELELLVLDKLRWDIDSIAPNDYIEIFLHRLNLNKHKHLDLIKRHYNAFSALCSTEFKFSFYPPSMIASSCLLAALDGLSTQLDVNLVHLEEDMSNLLFNFSQIDSECLLVLKEQINDMLNKSVPVEERAQIQTVKFEDDYDYNMDYNREYDDSFLCSESSLSSLNLNCKSENKENFVFISTETNVTKYGKKRSSTSSSTSSSSIGACDSYYSSQLSNSNYFMLTPPSANALPLPMF